MLRKEPVFMQSLIIEGTAKTPFVKLDPQNNEFVISGRSIPNDAEFFYQPVLEWFDSYVADPSEETVLRLDLDYFNISSSKRLLFILYKLNDLVETGNKVKLVWTYREEDDDMLEVGQDYAFMVKVPFEFIPKSVNVPMAELV